MSKHVSKIRSYSRLGCAMLLEKKSVQGLELLQPAFRHIIDKFLSEKVSEIALQVFYHRKITARDNTNRWAEGKRGEHVRRSTKRARTRKFLIKFSDHVVIRT